MPAPSVVVKHRVLFIREHAAQKEFVPLATRDLDDPNADEDFQALRLDRLITAIRSGGERPQFGEGVQTAGHPDGYTKGQPTVITWEKFGPQGPVAA